jgi:hypothetical protein
MKPFITSDEGRSPTSVKPFTDVGERDRPAPTIAV